MSTPEKCPKCGAGLHSVSLHAHNYTCLTRAWFGGSFTESDMCIRNQRDQLAERVRELEAWKESAMAVEREWDPNQLAAMLGGKPGESQRAVIQREVPVLVQRVKRLEVAGDAMAMAEGCRCDDGVICRRCADRVKAWHAAKGQP